MNETSEEAERDDAKRTKRGIRLIVRFTEAEYLRLSQMSREAGFNTKASYIRHCSLNLKRYIRAVEHLRAFIAEVFAMGLGKA